MVDSRRVLILLRHPLRLYLAIYPDNLFEVLVFESFPADIGKRTSQAANISMPKSQNNISSFTTTFRHLL
jgi:hypothetical protein